MIKRTQPPFKARLIEAVPEARNTLCTPVIAPGGVETAPAIPASESPAPTEATVSVLPLASSAAIKPSTAHVGQGATGDSGGDDSGDETPQATPTPAAIANALATALKERRGRRYRSFETIRRGLAATANKVEQGKLEPKAGAVIVQALQAVAAILTTMEATKLHEQAADLEEKAKGGDDAS